MLILACSAKIIACTTSLPGFWIFRTLSLFFFRRPLLKPAVLAFPPCTVVSAVQQHFCFPLLPRTPSQHLHPSFSRAVLPRLKLNVSPTLLIHVSLQVAHNSSLSSCSLQFTKNSNFPWLGNGMKNSPVIPARPGKTSKYRLTGWCLPRVPTTRVTQWVYTTVTKEEEKDRPCKCASTRPPTESSALRYCSSTRNGCSSTISAYLTVKWPRCLCISVASQQCVKQKMTKAYERKSAQ